jgi:hypothetical protein
MKNYLTYGNRTYYIAVDKIIEFCLKSENKNVRDSEITEGYEKLTDESNVLTLTSRVIRENTGTSNPQNDMITYDIFKMLLSILLGQEATSNPELNVSFAIAFNTMLEMGFLIEL